MVRSALDAAAPFEACVLKFEQWHLRIGGKRCVARGRSPQDGGSYLDGEAGWTERVSDDDTGCRIRMRRKGNVITYSYRKDAPDSEWKTVYAFEVSPDVYGDTDIDLLHRIRLFSGSDFRLEVLECRHPHDEGCFHNRPIGAANKERFSLHEISSFGICLDGFCGDAR